MHALIFSSLEKNYHSRTAISVVKDNIVQIHYKIMLTELKSII